LKFLRVEHFTAGFLRQAAEQRQIGFELTILSRIGRNVGDRRHGDGRIGAVAFGVNRNEVNAARRGGELSFIATWGGLLKALFLAGLIGRGDVGFEL